ncbi:MAG: serine hydrolase, partial [Pseudomonadota bacterium]|nr:serine hydrolase [Pseudomonadota bacterium]
MSNKLFGLLITSMILFFNTSTAELDQYSSKKNSDNLKDQANTFASRMVPLGFSGALLIADGDEIILNKGYGYADRKNKIPNTKNSVFSLGSIVKPFTAVSIMRLVQEGKIDLVDTLPKFFDGVPTEKQDITIKQMLSHTSGLSGTVGSDYDNISKEDLIEAAFNRPLDYQPGTDYGYSNLAFSLLAIIIEKVSGLSYEKYLSRNIFQPAGMTQTGYTLPTWDTKNIAHNYTGTEDNGTFIERDHYPNWNLIGNGGMLSTTTDLFKFYQFIKGNAFLDEETKETMFTPVWDVDALGIVALRDGAIIQHNGGGWDGNSALFRWYRKAGKMFMVFTNSGINNQPGFIAFEEPIDRLLDGESIEMPPEINVNTELNLSKMKGEYSVAENESSKLSIEPGYNKLRLESNSQEVINLFQFPDRDISAFKEWNRKIKIATLELIQDGETRGFKSLFQGSEEFADELASEIELEDFGTSASVKVLSQPASRKDLINTKIFITENSEVQEGLIVNLITDTKSYKGSGYDFMFISPYAITLIPSKEGYWVGYDYNTNQSF